MKPKVFVGSSSESLKLAYEIQQQLAGTATVVVWKGLLDVSNYTLESLIRLTKEYDFGIFVFAADDMIEMRGERYLTARDNVVFELGLFTGRLGRERNFLLAQRTPERLHLPSDLDGLIPATFDLDIHPGTKIKDVPTDVIHQALGVPCGKIRAAIEERGEMDALIPPLSGGMLYLLRHLATDRTYNLRELTEILIRYQPSGASKKLSSKEKTGWAKAAQYACQCLYALGLVDKLGGDEFAINKLGQTLVNSSKLQSLHESTFKLDLVQTSISRG